MSKRRPRANQNIYDLSIQHRGNLDGIGQMLIDNREALSSGVNTRVDISMLLEIPATPLAKDVKAQIDRRGIEPATGDAYQVEEWVKYSQAGIADVKCVTAGINGDIWYGTGDGLSRYNIVTGVTTNWTTSNSTLPTMQVQCLYYDAILDCIICGTAAGVAWYDMTTWQTAITTSDGLADNDVRFIVSAASVYAIGTAGGLSLATTDWATISNYTTTEGLASNDLHSAVVIGTVLWFTSDAGLHMMDDALLEIYDSGDGMLDDECTHICTDQLGRLWIATAAGINVYDGINFLAYTDADRLQSNSTGPMVLDRLGVLYIADKLSGSNTLSAVRWPDWQLITNVTSSLPNANIQGLAVDAMDNIWIATETAGLWRWNRNPLINQ